MRIKIERGTTSARIKRGFFARQDITTQDIRLTINFTEEERATIAAAGLAEYSFMEEPEDPIERIVYPNYTQMRKEDGTNVILVSRLMGAPVILRYANLLQANQGEAAIREACQNLKAGIEGGKPPETGSEEFEL